MRPPSRPGSPLWLRLAALGLAISLLLWLPTEDITDTWPLLFAAAFCTWLAVRQALRIRPGRDAIVKHSFLGGIMGLSVTPTAVFLMIFKSGWHAHGTPDFTPYQLWAVMQKTPAWVMGGLLIGMSAGLIRNNFDQP